MEAIKLDSCGAESSPRVRRCLSTWVIAYTGREPRYQAKFEGWYDDGRHDGVLYRYLRSSALDSWLINVASTLIRPWVGVRRRDLIVRFGSL